ncbi:ZP domain-containing protein-like [Bufo bufo]|uniref:ZP domain-containing protein-like n=1 Tax=Bufo bufo TaxID=8384 RepID=UPI001ABE96C1|nr:ZP domain-containing protein-like [Bufo bufo]
MTKSFTSISRSSTVRMVVKWTPSENNVGDHVPICFVAETYIGYQSEMRCVTAVVGPSSLDNIELICHENTMTLIAAKSSDHELYENQFRLNDPHCLVSSNSTHLIASVAYNSCGTEIEETEHDIVFKNQATSFVNKSSVITRKHGVSIPFNCSFPKKSRVSSSFHAHKSDYVFTEAGFGNFTYKFQFYTDDRFVEVETQYPLEVTLQELLYMEIQVNSSVPNVQLFVESCKATPHDNPSDPVFYDVIQNGCIKDETLVVYSATRTEYRFAMEAFAFIGDYSEVYVSCTVILCKFGESGTRCSQGCITKSQGDSSRQRHRRSLTSESQQHFISQGPLRMKRQSPGNTDPAESSSLNVNTLVISLSGVVIVALLGFIARLYTKRPRLSGYELLKTQDF